MFKTNPEKLFDRLNIVAIIKLIRSDNLAGAAGLEPTTPGFGDQCSTS